jgi:hypothetical protein
VVAVVGGGEGAGLLVGAGAVCRCLKTCSQPSWSKSEARQFIPHVMSGRLWQVT